MAAASPEAAPTEERGNPVKCPDAEETMGNEGVEEQPVTQGNEDIIYVAVGKEVKECKLNLLWALQNSGGKKVCFIHVHQPAHMIPLMGTKFPASSLKDQEVSAYREIERQNVNNILDDYILICRRMGVRAGKEFIEMESIEKGIVELVSQHQIKKLVMGAAANRQYSKKMMTLKSKKAIYVRLQAPAFCQIWFICKGKLIQTRQGMLMKQFRYLQESLSAKPESNHFKSQSGIYEQKPSLGSPGHPLLRRARSISDLHDKRFMITSSSYGSGEPSSSESREAHRAMDDWDGLSRNSFRSSRRSTWSSVGGADAARLSICSSNGGADAARLSTWSSVGGADAARLSICSSNGGAEAARLSTWSSVGGADAPRLSTWSSFDGVDVARSSILSSPGFSPFMFREARIIGSELSEPPPSLLDGSMEDDLFDQLRQAMAEAENSRRDAFEEAVRRAKAERDAVDALRRARASEILYAEESRLRKELEESLIKIRNDVDKVKIQQGGSAEELQKAQEQKSSLESQLEEARRMEKELEQKMVSAVDLLQNYKKERDQLLVERDSALKQAEELRKSRKEASVTDIPRLFSEFSFFEIEEATRNFDSSLKIGEGGYGSIYKGLLRCTHVAIKRLNPKNMQGPSEFTLEVEILSRLRHPNLVTLIGVCPEAYILIYEYLPNGSLEDRLSCKDDTPPLSWKTRICIAAGLCSILMFLHSSKPQSVVHGDLKPSNILLDENFVCKLSNFGICHLISGEECSGDNQTVSCITDPKGTFTYMDPEFLATGQLTPKSDVYSFGIILLQLLTGRSALGISKEVQSVVDKGALKEILDPLAGEWPYVQAEQLARLALRCTDISRKNRPNLVSDVWQVLDPMKGSCGGSSSSHWVSEENRQHPPYFCCPIFQEIMHNPHVAADGFTYELEAIRGWLDSGHNTSPMTNAQLAHRDVIPNHALRSAIQEWMQSH